MKLSTAIRLAKMTTFAASVLALAMTASVVDAGWIHVPDEVNHIQTLPIDDLDDYKSVSIIEKNKGAVHLDKQKRITGIHFPSTQRPRKHFEEVLSLVKKLKHIEAVSITISDINDAELECLAHLANLKWVHLTSSNVTDNGLKQIAKHTKLEELRLGGNLTDAGISSLAPLQELRKLAIYSRGFSGSGWKDMPLFPKLEVFETIPLNDEGLKGLAKNTSLKKLVLIDADLTNAGMKSIGKLVNLEELSLENRNIDDDGVKELAPLRNLKSLSLHGTKITGKSLVTIGGLTNLEGLGLANTRIADADLIHLLGLQKLKVLGLGNTKVSDPGIVPLAGLKSLRALHVEGTQVTPEGRRQFLKLRPLVDVELK